MKIVHQETVFTGKRYKVERRKYLTRDNVLVFRDIVIHPGAVTILPILEDNIVMIRNLRHVTVEGESLLELPAGTREPDEPSIVTAKRELEEETGYVAETITPFAKFYTSPGITNELMEVFIAHGLVMTEQKLEEGEQIAIETISIEDAKDMLFNGQFADGKTVATLGMYFARRCHE